MVSLKELLMKFIDNLSGEMIGISDDIHAKPELGYKEYFASNLLSSKLENYGFIVEHGIAGLETSFKARYICGSGGPRIAFLAEYDALPSLGHACGHNIIGTAAVGAGIALSKIASEAGLNCEIVVFGTPAEEGAVDNAGGKVLMIDEISKVDIALMIHPSDKDSMRYKSLAREAFKIEFFGKAAHAAGSPHKGINALEALILTFVSINALRQHLLKGTLIHGIIDHGGVSPNIVPEYACGRFYARAESMDYLMEVVEKIKKCMEGAALQTGAKPKFTKTANTYANFIPNVTLIKTASENFKFLGVKPPTLEEIMGVEDVGSTDFGNVSHVVPSLEINVSIVPQGTPGHSIEFAKAAGSEGGHRGLILGIKLLALTGLDLVLNPKLIEEAKAELFERKKNQIK
ncbi:MAG: M20 family metallopeptidase [Candidatus Methanomethylicia archaeon]